MELVFGDKLQLIRMGYVGSIGRHPVKVLSDAIFVKMLPDGLNFYYHLPDADPKTVTMNTLDCIVTVNDKPYK